MTYQTDKSGRFSVDSMENYREACKPHFTNDATIDEDEHLRLQKEMNAHSTMWTRILRTGEEAGGSAPDRVKNNLLVENHGLAPLYGLRKDHKPTDDENVGPPVRPVCGGNAGYNSKFSHLISMVIKNMHKEEDTVCENTEELLAEIMQLNLNKIERDIVVGSLDVKALYPSLDVDFTAEVVAKAFRESEYQVKGVDYTEVGLYLSLNLSENELIDAGIADVCPTRKNKRGRPPKITGCAVDKGIDKRYAPWNKPKRTPDDVTCKKMLSEALKVAIKFIMKNHVYRYGDEMKKQTKGGPIGLELTGELAGVFMSWWDKEFLKELRRIGIEILMYKRYVDDVNIIMVAPNAGLDYIDGRVVVNEERRSISEDENGMTLLKKVGDSIHKSIQLEADYPSRHEDHKLPLLDIKMWVEEQQDDENTERVVLHEYYAKDVSSKVVVHAESAMPGTTKRTVLTQEALRVMLRCSPLLPWETTVEHINMFMRRMQYSGYTQQYRAQIANAALKAYEEIKEKDKNGEQPMYRTKKWRRSARQQQKREKKKSWYKKGGYDTVVFVPPTPKSKLRRSFENEIKKTDFKIKVIETAGTPIKRLLQKSQPFPNKKCKNEEKCMVCRNGDSGMCRNECVTYRIECSSCDSVYIGESARNAYSRGIEHTVALQNKDKDSVLYRHLQDKHSEDENTPTFKMSVIDAHRSALNRQISEAVHISNTPDDDLINRRSEWGHQKIVRCVLTSM